MSAPDPSEFGGDELGEAAGEAAGGAGGDMPDIVQALLATEPDPDIEDVPTADMDVPRWLAYYIRGLNKILRSMFGVSPFGVGGTPAILDIGLGTMHLMTGGQEQQAEAVDVHPAAQGREHNHDPREER